MSQETKKAPNIDAIKRLLRDVLTHGDQVEVGDMLGVKSAQLSRKFAVDGDRIPDLFHGLREAWAISVVNPEAGWKLKAFVNGLFDNWLSPVKPTEKNMTTLIREAQEGLTALVSAKLDGKPLSELREEGRTARGALDQLLASLDLEFELRSESDIKQFQKRAS